MVRRRSGVDEVASADQPAFARPASAGQTMHEGRSTSDDGPATMTAHALAELAAVRAEISALRNEVSVLRKEMVIVRQGIGVLLTRRG